MKSIASLIRQRSTDTDAPPVKAKRKLGLDPKLIAKDAMERYRGVVNDDDEFLAEDGPDFDSDDYINTTGLEDGLDLGEVEGTGDKRKGLLMRAMSKWKR